MNDFLQALPWRLAALASLVVGAVSVLGARTDFWFGMERVGAAFTMFFVIGSIACKLLIVATPSHSGITEQPRTGSPNTTEPAGH